VHGRAAEGDRRMSWELAIGFIAGEVAGIVIMAILSGRLDDREKRKRERQWAEEQGLLYPENKKDR